MKRYQKATLSVVAVLLLVLAGLLISGYLNYKELINERPLAAVISQAKENPSYVEIEEIDPFFIEAILAIEDPAFYEHGGIRLSNIIEAFFTNVIEHEYAMGGSTISQQLCKNLYFNQKKQLLRKVSELYFVHDIESMLEKDEILELYLNVIYFGDGYYGIKEACEGYFHTTPDQLTKAQATMLAGLPQAPANYQLSDGYELAKKRQKQVLEAMVEQEVITEKEMRTIYKEAVES
ncbi:transglycosylase domain-containing protein [Massilicoli timonensis]|uniref:Transglycosylase domain-containing protein n=1 Tax=Massilicoli timonensis TaxID=2015901 RepID=A0ABT1SHH6_9FIRM|nr:transglycosylase domain-containing protein [Massilicoli timonensis]